MFCKHKKYKQLSGQGHKGLNCQEDECTQEQYVSSSQLISVGDFALLILWHAGIDDCMVVVASVGIHKTQPAVQCRLILNKVNRNLMGTVQVMMVHVFN